MSQKDLGFQNQFTQPVNQIITMLLIVIAVFVGGYFLYPAVSPIFVASPYLNSFIFFVFLMIGMPNRSKALKQGVSTPPLKVFVGSSPVAW